MREPRHLGREDENSLALLKDKHGTIVFPRIGGPLTVGVMGIENDDGELIGAVGGYLAFEAILMIDPKAPKVTQWKAIKKLFPAGLEYARTRGLDLAYLGVPEGLEAYTERLEKMKGFKKDTRSARFLVNLYEAADVKNVEEVDWAS